jgi:hypothetical protein
VGANAQVGPELDAGLSNDSDDGADSNGPGIKVNRTISKGVGAGMSHHGSGKAKSTPELSLSIDGLNHFQQRFVAGGGKSIFH